jgi:hypothetical protein
MEHTYYHEFLEANGYQLNETTFSLSKPSDWHREYWSAATDPWRDSNHSKRHISILFSDFLPPAFHYSYGSWNESREEVYVQIGEKVNHALFWDKIEQVPPWAGKEFVEDLIDHLEV